LDLDEKWRTSAVAYTELVFRPIIKSGYTPRDMGSPKAVRRALTGASVNKAIFALFTMAGALFPFLLYATRLEDLSLAVTVSLSILLVFGYVVLYCVQVLPSFVSSGSFAPLTAMPLASREVTTVAAMTLWRTLDYILLASLICQIGAVAFFTDSPAGTLSVAFASVLSSLLAVGLSLWLTSIFQKRLEGGGLSGIRAFFRPLYFILWGLGVMSAVFLFSLISYVAPPVQTALSDPFSPSGFVLSLILPFSAGLVSAHFQGEQVSQLSLTLGLAGLGIAAAVTVAATRVTMGVVTGVVLPTRELASSADKRGLVFRVSGPLRAYILKDLRVSSRNPATGFLFALPFFEIIAVVVPLTAASVVKMSVVLVGAQVGGGFALFVAFLLVTVEDLGVERRTALPFNESVRTLSKVVVSTAAFLPVPVALGLVLTGKPTTFWGSALVSPLAVVSVFAACVFEVSVLKALAENGRGTAVKFAAGIGSGEFVLLLPALIYSGMYILSRDHTIALSALAVSTALELVAACSVLYIKNRSRREVRVVRPEGVVP
jgi:hypothetical protein